MAIEEVKSEPDQEVIEELESLLMHARSGRLQSIAFIGDSNEGEIVTGRAGHIDFVKFIGLCHVLQTNLTEEMQLASCGCGECDL